MAVFISVSTDPFEEVFNDASQRRGEPQVNVRRPLRGLQIKKDTYAVLKVLTATGEEVSLFDSSSSLAYGGVGLSQGGISNFIIQQLQETRVEKQQIVETFGEDYIFFFGERPRFINVSGVLLNTADFNWKSEFWANYEKYLRGTKLVENNARLYLYFDDIVVEGYLVQASTTQQAVKPYHLPFNFQMFVSNYAILSTVGSIYFQQDAQQAIPQGGVLPDSKEAQAELAAKAARQGSPGGLTGFLATTSEYLSSASFAVQNTLNNIKERFSGRRIVLPEGLGTQVVVPPISNQASFKAPEINQPIHYNTDEYVERAPDSGQQLFDQEEQRRVNDELKLRSPKQLEDRARKELAKLGVDTTRREAEYQLHGRAAFSGFQKYGSFGIRQADGELTLP
jgi:hypothetical protein